MDDFAAETNQGAEFAGITVAYRGAGSQTEAENLYRQLKESGLKVEPPSEIRQEGGRLGATEIIITIVVTAAVKAVITTSLKYLEEYLRERIKKKDSDVNLRVEIKKPLEEGKPFPFSLRGATVETAIAFSENLRKAVSGL